jgi:hypothetical protein
MSKPASTILILFAGIVSAISAGQMLGNRFGDSLTADFRAVEARHRVEMQRFMDAQDVDLERRRAERERQVRVIQDAMRNLNAPSNPNARTK